jgi:hypothetical protein
MPNTKSPFIPHFRLQYAVHTAYSLLEIVDGLKLNKQGLFRENIWY